MRCSRAAIAELRTALGDDPKHPRYIETPAENRHRLIDQCRSLNGAIVRPAAGGGRPSRHLFPKRPTRAPETSPT